MYKFLFTIVFVLVCSIIAAGMSSGAEFCVDNVTQFQNALTTAETNSQADTVKVVQGTYIGNFSFLSNDGQSITVKGGYNTGCTTREIDANNTILYGDQTDSVLYLSTGIGGDAFVEGFTVENGNANNGGGIYIFCYSNLASAGSITVTQNTVSGNNTDSDGAGIYARSLSNSGTAGHIIITHNTVKVNTAGYNGGGIYALSDSGSGSTGNITLTNNLVAGNIAQYGGGIIANTISISGTSGNVSYTNNTFTGNHADSQGGGIRIIKSNNINSLYNNIIWGNTGFFGADDIDITGTGTANAYNNDYAVMTGSWTNFGNNINTNPNFVSSSNYHLKLTSLCIDVGTNSAPDLPSTDLEGDPRVFDGDGNGTDTADMGADEYVFQDGDELAGDFGTNALWHYDGSWLKISNWNPDDGLSGWSGGLAVDFGTNGVWNNDGSSWGRITSWNAGSAGLTNWHDSLAIDFDGNGLWNFNGSSWSKMSNWDVDDDLAGWEGGLAADFGGNGLWNYDGASWNRTTTWNVGGAGLTSWNGGLAADFGTNGLWSFDGSAWHKLTAWDPEDDLTGWSGGLAVDFGTNGLWSYDGASWASLTTWNAGVMTGVSDGLVVDFGTNGVWKYAGTSWSKLTNWSAENMDDCDLN